MVARNIPRYIRGKNPDVLIDYVRVCMQSLKRGLAGDSSGYPDSAWTASGYRLHFIFIGLEDQ